MDSIKPTSAPSKSKFAKTFHKVTHFKTATKTLSNNAFCLLIPQDKCRNGDHPNDESAQHFRKEDKDEAKIRNRAAMEAFVSKLFATISAVKASYAELQIAQFPYNNQAVQSADQAVVDELKALSELKKSFMKKQIDTSPPHVTVLLAEIQEQQSLMKMYEITMKKMEAEIEAKSSQISSLQNELKETILNNKSLEKRLNASGCFSVLDNVKLSDSNPKDFILVLHYALRSIRNFVKLLVREMQSASWDIDVAVNAIEPDLKFSNPNHRCFVFESFVCREMFHDFNTPTFSLLNVSLPNNREEQRLLCFDQFKKLKSASSVQFLKHHQDSTFGKFTRAKYLRLVHPKMEASFYGNLNQRKVISAREFPETPFFAVFAEMARRVWLLHCLAFSFSEEVNIFQVRKNCRFSEVYMESVTNEVLAAAGSDIGVAFTVLPGFKIGSTVVQSQVFLSPAEC